MNISFADFDPRRHLGARFALLLGSTGLAFGLIAALLVGNYQRAQLEDSFGQGMRREAILLSRSLNVALQERGRQLHDIATLPILSSGLMEDLDALRLLEDLHKREPDWAWLALLNAEGQVLVATGNELKRPHLGSEAWFATALKTPWIGAQKVLPTDASALSSVDKSPQSLQLVFAQPIVDFRGRTIMVLAGQLPIGWLQEQHAALHGTALRLPGSDSLVLDGSGRVLSGPPALQGDELRYAGLTALEQGGAPSSMTWPDGTEYLTALGRADTSGDGFSASLRVVLRQPSALAFAVANRLEHRIVLAGVLGTVLFMLLSLWLARRTTRPLQALSSAAASIRAGGTADFAVLARQHRDEVGALAGSLQALYLDLGQRMEDERYARERFESLFQGAPVALCLVAEHHFVVLNAAALQLFGATDEAQLRGRHAFDFIHPDDLPLLKQVPPAQPRVALQLPPHRIVRLDGGMLDIQATAIPVDVNGVPGFQMVLVDVTAANRQRQELQEREAQLAKVSRMSKVGGWTIDLATNRVTRTEEFQRIFELAGATDRFTPEDMRKLLSADDFSRLSEATQLLRSAGTPFDLELSIHLPSGNIKRLHAQGLAIYDGDRIVGQESIVQDITELHQAEEALRSLNAELEHRVAERTEQLQAANAELDSFAYAVSHDLRAPLRAISGFSQALIEDHGKHLDGEAQGFLNQIIQASHRMGDLIDGLLSLSRITRNEPQRSDVDLSAMAQSIVSDLRRADPSRQVQVDIQPGLHASGDARMLDAVLQNLLGNAWKYSARTAAATITFKRQRIGADDWFCVSDNGAGFNMAYAGRLFKAFSRLHRQDEFQGIGIGLATVQRIVHRHGGRIEAEGAPDQGATFRFTLPELAPIHPTNNDTRRVA